MVETDTAAQHADEGMRGVQPGGRDRGERGARGIILLDLLGQRDGDALRRRLGRLDNEDLAVLPEQHCHPCPDPIHRLIPGGISLEVPVLADKDQRADRLGGLQGLMLAGCSPHVDLPVQRPPLTRELPFAGWR